MTDGLVSWSVARRAAREAADSLPVVSVPLVAAVGAVLAEPLVATTALPPADAARVDGWAVSGPGPWDVVPGPVDHLADGCAVEVGAGGVLPFGADSVLRADHALVLDEGRGGRLHVGDPASGRLAPHAGYVEPGSDVRPRGEEAAAGEMLLQAGGIVTPAVAALAASAGLDALPVVRPPDVAILVPGEGSRRARPDAARLGRLGRRPRVPAGARARRPRRAGRHDRRRQQRRDRGDRCDVDVGRRAPRGGPAAGTVGRGRRRRTTGHREQPGGAAGRASRGVAARRRRWVRWPVC